MSSRQYTVAVKLVDKDGILAKLGKASGGGGGGGGAGGGSSSGGLGGGVLDKIAGAGAGQLLKLTGIGLGIAELVKLGVKSSGILQQNFKLWETSMMLIFRPITDFVGLVLRPFTMLFLQWMVIPFFQKVYPFFRDWGTAIGKFFADPKAAFSAIIDAIAGLGTLLIANKVLGRGLPGKDNSPILRLPGCIELCDKTAKKLEVPFTNGVTQGIGQSAVVGTLVANTTFLLTMNSSLLDMKNDVRSLRESMGSILNRLPAPAAVPAPALGRGSKSVSVGISDSLSMSDGMSNKLPMFGPPRPAGLPTSSSIESDWSNVASSSRSAANSGKDAAGAIISIATLLQNAKLTLEKAVSDIRSATPAISSPYGGGGGTSFNPIRVGGVLAAGSLRMAGMVDTLK